MTLLDELVPVYDVAARYRTHVRADPAAVYDALRRADFAASPLIRMLFLLRRLPAWFVRAESPSVALQSRTLRDLIGRGFGLVAERPGDELVLDRDAGPVRRQRHPKTLPRLLGDRRPCLRLDSTRDPAADSAQRRAIAVAQHSGAVGCGP